MRTVLAVLVLLLLAGGWWLLGGQARGGARRGDLEPADVAAATEEPLATPPAVSKEEGATEDPADKPSSRAERRAKVAAQRPSNRGVLRGRLVVAESGDPIEAVLSVRLRTLDLNLTESLRTLADGSFTSTRAFPRGALLALVTDDEGRELVDHEAAFEPSAKEEWLVKVPESRWPTFAFGRVVGRGGPVSAARVQLVPLASDETYDETLSNEDGAFRFEGLRAGPYRVRAVGRWSRTTPVELVLRTGPNDLGDVRLPEPAAGGDVRVRIVTEDPERWPGLLLELRESTGTFALRTSGDEGGQADDGAFEFLYEDVPAGRYTLELRALDGLVYEPASCSFSPPATLEVRAHGVPHTGWLVRALDAQSGEELLGFSAFGRLGRTWELVTAREVNGRMAVLGALRSRNVAVAELHLDPGFERWVVWASGYRAAYGSCSGGEGTIVARLEKGWCEILQFEDAEGDSTSYPNSERYKDPPILAGVEVFADGHFAGASDADGVVALAGETEPEALEFRLPGWRQVGEYRFGILHTVLLARSP